MERQLTEQVQQQQQQQQQQETEAVNVNVITTVIEIEIDKVSVVDTNGHRVTRPRSAVHLPNRMSAESTAIVD
jgi:hypothetical protein